jgi:hypothetical protein
MMHLRNGFVVLTVLYFIFYVAVLRDNNGRIF